MFNSSQPKEETEHLNLFPRAYLDDSILYFFLSYVLVFNVREIYSVFLLNQKE